MNNIFHSHVVSNIVYGFEKTWRWVNHDLNNECHQTHRTSDINYVTMNDQAFLFLKKCSRWRLVGHLNQGHSQGSDIIHLQHGSIETGSQLWLPGHRGEWLWVRVSKPTVTIYIRLVQTLSKLENQSEIIQRLIILMLYVSVFNSSTKSVSVLWGMVVSGGGGSGRPHFHPASSFHPHHQRPEQEICQEIWLKYVSIDLSVFI